MEGEVCGQAATARFTTPRRRSALTQCNADGAATACKANAAAVRCVVPPRALPSPARRPIPTRPRNHAGHEHSSTARARGRGGTAGRHTHTRARNCRPPSTHVRACNAPARPPPAHLWPGSPATLRHHSRQPPRRHRPASLASRAARAAMARFRDAALWPRAALGARFRAPPQLNNSPVAVGGTARALRKRLGAGAMLLQRAAAQRAAATLPPPPPLARGVPPPPPPPPAVRGAALRHASGARRRRYERARAWRGGARRPRPPRSTSAHARPSGVRRGRLGRGAARPPSPQRAPAASSTPAASPSSPSSTSSPPSQLHAAHAHP
jgi:hypothetical protein